MQDTFQVDFVVQVAGSPGQTDNNKNRDFRLPLLNAPTAEDVVRRRAQEASRFEAAAMQASCCKTCLSDSKTLSSSL